MPSVGLQQLGPHLTRVDVGMVTLWFSYNTCIGFRDNSGAVRVPVLSENCWSTTTGKHLNQVGDKSLRIPRDEFLKRLGEVLRVERVQIIPKEVQ